MESTAYHHYLDWSSNLIIFSKTKSAERHDELQYLIGVYGSKQKKISLLEMALLNKAEESDLKEIKQPVIRVKAKFPFLRCNWRKVDSFAPSLLVPQMPHNKNESNRNGNFKTISELVHKSGQWKFKEDRLLIDLITRIKKIAGAVIRDADWLRIQKSFPERKVSECKKRYENVLSPVTNSESFDSSELSRLSLTAGRYVSRNWTLIAEEHGNGRSAFDCFSAYKSHIETGEIKGSWTFAESEILREGVKIYGSDWKAISTLIPGRTHIQIYNKQKNMGLGVPQEIVQGKWSAEEDRLLIEAIKKEGLIWNRIVNYVPNRSENQCRARYNQHLNPALNKSKFTTEENERLTKLVGLQGPGKWADMAVHFPGRHREMLSNGWKAILSKRKRDLHTS